MALISLRQLLDHAAENNYGVPSFNVNNLEQIQAGIDAWNKRVLNLSAAASGRGRARTVAPSW